MNFRCKKLKKSGHMKTDMKKLQEKIEKSQKFYHRWRSQKPKAEVLSYSFPFLGKVGKLKFYLSFKLYISSTKTT